MRRIGVETDRDVRRARQIEKDIVEDRRTEIERGKDGKKQRREAERNREGD